MLYYNIYYIIFLKLLLLLLLLFIKDPGQIPFHFIFRLSCQTLLVNLNKAMEPGEYGRLWSCSICLVFNMFIAVYLNLLQFFKNGLNGSANMWGPGLSACCGVELKKPATSPLASLFLSLPSYLLLTWVSIISFVIPQAVWKKVCVWNGFAIWIHMIGYGGRQRREHHTGQAKCWRNPPGSAYTGRGEFPGGPYKTA